MHVSDLEEYRRKRDFEKTAEPGPSTRSDIGPLRFVVQKHRASRLHYDFRLELNGVLKSWAVPKGPSLNPEEKRLAAMVEDHPLDYASFEGNIPAGQYGAGEVIVWDEGVYSPDEDRKYYFTDRESSEKAMTEGLSSGKLSFHLRGKKLRGSWTLVRMRGKGTEWLLIKHKDEFATGSIDVLEKERSATSGRTIEEIRGDQAASQATAANRLKRFTEGNRSSFPGFLKPMLASTASAPFSNNEWSFEPKLDGYRVIATLRNGKPKLYSRNGIDLSEEYGPLLASIASQPASEMVIDGEMVALDEKGRVSFELLRRRGGNGGGKGGRQPPLMYYVFDVLYLDGYMLMDLPLEARRAILKSTLRETDQVKLTDSFEADGRTVFQAAVKSGLEGVVGKKTSSTYQSGRRSTDWLKIKATHSGDFVVGGYTTGEGSRAGSIGALLIGYYDDKGALVFAGHVGSGFNDETLSELGSRLGQLTTDRSPFLETPPTNGPATWVRPELVAEVEYLKWTKDGRLRAPVFQRVREDKGTFESARLGTIEPPDTSNAPTLSDTVKGVLHQLETTDLNFELEVDGSRIELKHVDKVLWPPTEVHGPITKLDFIAYLTKVSPFLLPHLKDRPLTLSRYPDGITGEHFWQKHWNHPVPDFVTTVDIGDEAGKPSEYIVCNNLPTLLWLGQAADIEFHTWYSRTEAKPDLKVPSSEIGQILDYPDFIVFDIDPYVYSGAEKEGDEPEFNRAGFDKTCEVALLLKETLETIGMTTFVKTSGKTGLHVYVPIVRKLGFRAVRQAAETIGRFLVQKHPQDITLEWAVEKRRGKVFVDYNQNVRGKTLASVYSPRPNREAGVSFPLKWDELGKSYPADYNVATVPQMLERRRDVWGGILSSRNDVEKVLGIKGQ